MDEFGQNLVELDGERCLSRLGMLCIHRDKVNSEMIEFTTGCLLIVHELVREPRPATLLL